jgi:RND superfamily putative drug exporter
MLQPFFDRLGRVSERHWRSVLLLWLLLAVAGYGLKFGLWKNLAPIVGFAIPQWSDVVQGGEFAYLPDDMQSLVGEKLLAEAFPQDLLKSSVVVVVRRESHPLVEADERFLHDVLRPKLEEIAESTPDGRVASVKTSRDPLMGKILVSDDRKASLAVIALTTEFLDHKNGDVIAAVEKVVSDLQTELDRATGQPVVPPGLSIALSGTATVGRDMLKASRESSQKTEVWTVVLVIGLLLLIYRAPFLAFIPLLTVFVSVNVALGAIILLTRFPSLPFRVFWGLEVYITVVCYGAGVDYCLFLIARYKEEADRGVSLDRAISQTLSKVGAALTASAGTVICGIGMMVFAQFGKFREAGVGISLSLVIVLLASLTLTPALLRMMGRLAFWPLGRTEHISGTGWLSGTSLVNRLVERNRVHRAWEWLADVVVNNPVRVLVSCFVVMLPFAGIGLWFHDFLSYGLLSELRSTNQSVIGAKAVQAHFPAGYAGPVTVLLRNELIDFRSEEGRKALDAIALELKAARNELGLVDLRNVRHPLGWAHSEILDENAQGDAGRDSVKSAARGLRNFVDAKRRREADAYYVSSAEGHDGTVTRFDLIFRDDPFSKTSISQLDDVQNVIRQKMPLALKGDTTLHLVGPTASIRDLKTVTDRDQIKIDILVLGVVFLILVALLRKPFISFYLIASVFFSYFVTLGATFAVFWWLDGGAFAGLDWKVPMFLFTILIAIGEDYNIFLMTRIEEEQAEHGAVEGVRTALLKTGSIISSCGIIMAGTFFSLILGGTLVGMQQLGFALSFGVVLDTFVVRPLLVPAYLVLVYGGHFGRVGHLLGDGHAARLPMPARATEKS